MVLDVATPPMVAPNEAERKADKVDSTSAERPGVVESHPLRETGIPGKDETNISTVQFLGSNKPAVAGDDGSKGAMAGVEKAVSSPLSRSSTKVMSPAVSSLSLASKKDTPAGSNRHKHITSIPAETPTAGRLSELKRFTLWETRTNFYLVAYNTSQTRFRILKVSRTPERLSDGANETADSADVTSFSTSRESKSAKLVSEEGKESTTRKATAKAQEEGPQSVEVDATHWDLSVTSDRVVYTRSQVSELLDMISEGNKATGGLKEVGRFFGIVGFIRFTSTYYMVLISKRSVVALLGGHYIYHSDETKIIPVCHANILSNLPGRTKALDQEEARLLHTFKQVDLSKNFYFSYTYDLTKTLQDNLTTEQLSEPREKSSTSWGYNEKFIWNHHLLLPAFASSRHSWKQGSDVEAASEWVLPLVYGFVDQAKLCVLNCTIHVTLIARRSRHFAGARFLKRGTDEKGHVANDVETEQIVSDALTTPFFAPKSSKPGGHEAYPVGPNPRYTSYVMHRGSIPIYWTQDSTNMSPRPPIEISVVDPYYASAALHFDDMLRRYGYPLIVLNLIKSKEKQPREVKLLNAFGECVGYLNQFLPADRKIKYIAWDMSRASKSRDQDVIGVLEDIAEETITSTKFFHSGPEPYSFAFKKGFKQRRETILLQSGVARVNCVDCLDRTNAAQFVIGKAAFGHQLHALGLLDDPSLPFDSAAVDMLTEMYHDLGDTIALQYGGSHLVNTMETYRKINQWTSHSRDMLEGLKRYYANSFVDADKQAAINLFLGVDSDHAEGPVSSVAGPRRHYQQWYTPQYLEPRDNIITSESKLNDIVNRKGSFWAEYYRPSLFTDLLRHHAFKMTAVHQHMTMVPSAPSTMIAASPSSRLRLESNSSGRVPSSPMSGSAFAKGAQRASFDVATTTSSPFTSRIAGSVAAQPIDPVSSSHSSVASPHVPQKAIIGGVRRWISLNRSDPAASRTSAASHGDPKKKSMKTNEGRGDEPHKSTLTSDSAWPTWEEITGTAATAPGTEALLTTLMNPNVSSDEAKEYAWWLDQFRDIAFDGGLPTSIPEPAALMPAAPGIVGGIGGLAPLYQVGNRRPATQKQKQQIAEADAELYDYDVGISQGQAFALAKLQKDEREEDKADPALLHYPLSANTLNSIPHEKKIKAFSSWITGPNRTTTPLLPIKV